jgi:hypothetical protein
MSIPAPILEVIRTPSNEAPTDRAIIRLAQVSFHPRSDWDFVLETRVACFYHVLVH